MMVIICVVVFLIMYEVLQAKKREVEKLNTTKMRHPVVEVNGIIGGCLSTILIALIAIVFLVLAADEFLAFVTP